jgi:hypothetical protein
LSTLSSDGEHWDVLQELFARFEHVAEPERAQALASACPDPHLRKRVLDLLRAAEAMVAEIDTYET